MFLYVFNGSNHMKFQNVKRLPDNYISVNGGEATPIEDYGDYFLSNEDYDIEDAFWLWKCSNIKNFN